MTDSLPVFRTPPPRILLVAVDRPWDWLASGWRDLLAHPWTSLAYGAALAAVGWIALAILFWLDLPYLAAPLTAGFFFIGPFAAVGLYEASRLRAAGETVRFATTAVAWRRNVGQIALMGLMLLLLHLAWMRIAQLLYAGFLDSGVPAWSTFAHLAFESTRSLPFLVAGVACGAALAACAFLIGAFSIPMLLDRPESNVFEAIGTSVAAVRANPRPMLLWAGLIVVFTGFGMAAALLGLLVTLPLVAHATWHAYRDVVRFET
jgi:uncharacterized membrane protein